MLFRFFQFLYEPSNQQHCCHPAERNVQVLMKEELEQAIFHEGLESLMRNRYQKTLFWLPGWQWDRIRPLSSFSLSENRKLLTLQDVNSGDSASK